MLGTGQPQLGEAEERGEFRQCGWRKRAGLALFDRFYGLLGKAR